MTTVTISRGSTSVDIKLYREAGQPAIARDIGKPDGGIIEVAQEDPRSKDHVSGTDTVTLLGIIEGASAYSDAKTLAEDLVKPHSSGTALQLDATSVPGFDKILDVGVPSANACRLNYRPGRKNRVDVRLTLPAVSTTVG